MSGKHSVHPVACSPIATASLLLHPLQPNNPTVRDLAQVRGEGRLARLITARERVNLVIVDHWGLEPFTANQRRDPLEIVDELYEKGPLITSQDIMLQWHYVNAIWTGSFTIRTALSKATA